MREELDWDGNIGVYLACQCVWGGEGNGETAEERA